MSCPECEQLKKTNKELHRRAQKAESDKAQLFKTHSPVLADLANAATMLQIRTREIRNLYKKEWRQFQVDDPLFKERYEQYIEKSSIVQQFKNWIIRGVK